jgi:hypothetical protein
MILLQGEAVPCRLPFCSTPKWASLFAHFISRERFKPVSRLAVIVVPFFSWTGIESIVHKIGRGAACAELCRSVDSFAGRRQLVSADCTQNKIRPQRCSRGMQALPCPTTSLKPCITRTDGIPSYRLTIAGLGNRTLRFYDPAIQPFSSTRPRRERQTRMRWASDRTTRPCVLSDSSPFF